MWHRQNVCATLETGSKPQVALCFTPSPDRPHALDAVAAHGVEAVVQVRGRVTVRHDELQPLAEARQFGAGLSGENAELVAADAVVDDLPIPGLGAEGDRGVESLGSRIDGDAVR